MKQSLHIVSRSPFTTTDLTKALGFIGNQDALLLCGEAVQALRTGLDFQLPLFTYALLEDVQARAITTDIICIDYKQMVALTLEYQRVHTWQ